jgi:hypothetical protein
MMEAPWIARTAPLLVPPERVSFPPATAEKIAYVARHARLARIGTTAAFSHVKDALETAVMDSMKILVLQYVTAAESVMRDVTIAMINFLAPFAPTNIMTALRPLPTSVSLARLLAAKGFGKANRVPSRLIEGAPHVDGIARRVLASLTPAVTRQIASAAKDAKLE